MNEPTLTVEEVDVPLWMLWRGRARALRALDRTRYRSHEATCWKAETFDECADELEAAVPAPSAPADAGESEFNIDDLLNNIERIAKFVGGDWYDEGRAIIALVSKLRAALRRSQPPQPTGDVGELVEREHAGDWNFLVPSTLAEICKVLRRRCDVHRNWAEYLETSGDEQYAKDAIRAGIGEAGNHRLYIRQYEAAINLIDAADSRIVALDHECQASMAEIAEGRRRAEAAEARVAELEKALEPFAEIATAQGEAWSDGKTADRMRLVVDNPDGTLKFALSLGHFRRARAARSLGRKG